MPKQYRDSEGKVRSYVDAFVSGGALELAEDTEVVAGIKGSRAVETLTDTDAVADVITFSAAIEAVEIWHNQAGLEEFVVNGITLSVGPGGWARPVGGTPAVTVTIPSGVACAVTRLA